LIVIHKSSSVLLIWPSFLVQAVRYLTDKLARVIRAIF
jgi:hypothetical protein